MASSEMYYPFNSDGLATMAIMILFPVFMMTIIIFSITTVVTFFM